MSTSHIKPLTGYIGAEITGVDLKTPGESLKSDLRKWLDTHKVIVFRGQNLNIDQQLVITDLLGSPMQLPYIEPTPDNPDVIAVKKSAAEVGGGVFGGDWHSDFSFLSAPPAGSILNAVTIPETGGDTLWSNQVSVLNALPSSLRERMENSTAIHVGKPYGVRYAPAKSEQMSDQSIKISRNDPAADKETRHPAVYENPRTGEKGLWVNPTYTVGFEDCSAEESKSILSELYRYVTRPEFCCRLSWCAGDLVIWDNFTTLHYAVNDYDGYDRLLYRTTFR